MSMLAERKRKQKWSLNPKGNNWSEDNNKFGQKLMEKMGWSAGKGLGANEDGVTEHVRVSYKNDSRGMGFKESNDQWTEHDSNFTDLLENLNTANKDIAAEIPQAQIGSNSLEKRSQKSKVRVHYHKFTRGKDLSRYSEKDLANIFGKKTLTDRRENNEGDSVREEAESEGNANDDQKDLKFGIQTLKGGSMTDYFKKKLTNFGIINNGFVVGKNGVLKKAEESDSEERPRLGFGLQSYEGSGNISGSFDVNKSGFGYSSEATTGRSTFQLDNAGQFTSSEKGEEVSENVSSKVKRKKNKKRAEDEIVTFKEDSVVYEAEGVKYEGNVATNIEDESNPNVPNGAAYEVKRKDKKKRKRKPENNETSEENRIEANRYEENRYEENRYEENRIEEHIIEEHRNKANRIEANRIEENAVREATIEENPYEIKRKAKKRKKNNVLALDNPNFSVDDSVNCDESTVGEEHKFEVKRKEKKTKKKKGENNQCLENDQFVDDGHRRDKTRTDNKQKMQEPIEENPYEVKVKSKKRKIRTEDEVLAIDNPNFSVNDSLNVKESVENSNDNKFEVKRKEKKSKKTKRESRQEQDGLDNPALNNSSQNDESLNVTKENVECDLMLNVAVQPVTPKTVTKPKPNFNSNEIPRRSQDTRRKSVRFSEVHEERIIPPNGYDEEDVRNRNELYGINTQVSERSLENQYQMTNGNGDYGDNQYQTTNENRNYRGNQYQMKNENSGYGDNQYQKKNENREYGNNQYQTKNENRNYRDNYNQYQTRNENSGYGYNQYQTKNENRNYRDNQYQKRNENGDYGDNQYQTKNETRNYRDNQYQMRNDNRNYRQNQYQTRNDNSFDTNRTDNGNFYNKPNTYRQRTQGFDNAVFDRRANNMQENIQSMTKTIDNYQAQVENDINERKIQVPFRRQIPNPNSTMIGILNVSNDRHRKLKDGTQLGFKLAHFSKPPAWFNKEAQLSSAKKSYKHLIVGDIIVGFKNTNLHAIEGYATVESLQKHESKMSENKTANQGVPNF